MSSKDKTELNQDENEVVNSGKNTLEAADDSSQPEMEEVETKETDALVNLEETIEIKEVTDPEVPLAEVTEENTDAPVLATEDVAIPEPEPEPESVEGGTEEPLVEEVVVEETSSEVEASEEASVEAKREIVASEEPVQEAEASEEPAQEVKASEEPSEKEGETTGDSKVPEEEGSETTIEEVVEKKFEGDPNVAPDEAVVSETMKQVKKILQEAESFDELVKGSNANELILILDFFTQSEHIRDNIPRAGKVKKAFDALKAGEEVPSGIQSRFGTALSRFNKKRSEYYKILEGEKEVNSKLKRDLLVRLKEIVDAEDMNRFKEVRDIQNEWKRIGFVRKEDMEELFREYRHLLDQFYKMREMYFQLRDYDRKINLAEKDKLLEELKGIIPSEENQENREIWQKMNDLLTDIQNRWKAVGHVPREDMDRINEAYRDVTEQFFSLRHEFYESEDQARQENADLKVAFLEKLKEFAEFKSDKPREWNDATNRLREMQEEWKKIGRAPQEVNSALWKEYRAIGNAFFTAKAEFFRNLDDVRNTNLAQKRTLCEQAEALKDNTDWEKTANELRRLQAEWKQIGSVPDRYSNKVWKRFRAACDAFFENRRAHYEVEKADELVNLEAKKALIEEVKGISIEKAGSVDKAIGQIKDLQARWKAIGRVPYKDKDSIWRVFRKEIDQFFDNLRANKSRGHSERVRASVESLPEDKRTSNIRYKMTKLRRRIEAAVSKIDSYSTNILYISKGKSGDGLRKQIQGSIDKEKKLLIDLEKQMRELQDLLKGPPKKEKKKEEKAEAAPETKAAEKVTEEKAEESTEVKAEETEAKVETPAVEEIAEEKAAEPEAKEETPAVEEVAEEKAAEPEAKVETPAVEEVAEEKAEEVAKEAEAAAEEVTEAAEEKTEEVVEAKDGAGDTDSEEKEG